MLHSVEILRSEVAQDADMRQRAKDATPWVGYQCGDKPLKHRCVRPKDAKTGNLVLLDVRNAGNEQDVLLGEWDGQYHLGTVSTREVDATSIVDDASTKSTKSKSKESKSKESKSTNKSKEYLLHLVMWEPYKKCGWIASPSLGGKRPSSKEWR